MEGRNLALNLLSLVVLASGCAHTSGTSTGSESSRAVTVSSVSVSPQEVYQGTSMRVSVDVENTGNLPAKVFLGKDGDGKRVLKNYCPDIFEIKEFSTTTTGEKRMVNGGAKSVSLEPGDRLNLRWQLSQQGDVPLYGFRCELEMEMPFNYSVQSYRQVQIKRSRDVQGSPKLYWESSSGPLRFAIQTIGGTEDQSSTFVATEEGERGINILLQLQNLGEEDYNKGVVDIDESSLAIKATPPLELHEGFTEIDEVKMPSPATGSRNFKRTSGSRENRLTGAATASATAKEWSPSGSAGYSEQKCDVQSSEEIRMFEGESRVISCNVDLPKKDELDAPSEISEIFAQVNYTYLKDIGSRTVEVKPRGG